MYFLTLLKRANVPAHDIICFYRTCIRPVLEYCAPLYHHALPDYLTKDIERIQRRALAIITPDLSYSESLLLYNMVSLEHRRSNQCNKFFESIVNNPDHKLHQLLPPTFTCKYNLRNPRKFVNPTTRTKRFSSTFITSMCRRYWAALVLVSYYGYKFFRTYIFSIYNIFYINFLHFTFIQLYCNFMQFSLRGCYMNL